MPELKVHSFIVKLWLEDAGHQKKPVGWHGQVTHVPSGEYRYLQELRDIVSFVQTYVGEISTDTTLVARVGRRLQAWMFRAR